MVFFFAHIPYVVNRTFNATPTEWLQQYHFEDEFHCFALWASEC